LKIYHFTAAHLLAGCLSDGLTLGKVPLIDRAGHVYLATGWQWLTTNPDWLQEWQALSSLPYPRNAHRLTICIPKSRRKRLFDWRRVVPGNVAAILGAFGDPENWRLFHGRIKPAWIDRIDNHPLMSRRVSADMRF
jgi:hypothetical protein